MTCIRIRERAARPDGGFDALLIFDGGEEYPIVVSDPFDAEAEQRLEWYYEEHLRFPFTGQVQAAAAAASVTAYGERLFDQVFADRKAYARYQAVLQSGIEALAIEIAGSPDFHALHWEALKDPDLPHPLAVQAAMVRRNLTPQTVRAQVRASPTLNVLVVTARPGGGADVGYRTISRPLVESLRQAGVPMRVEMLRPGTYPALLDCLESRGSGYYHLIHFDVHGALLAYDQYQAGVEANRFTYQARYGRADIAPYEGYKAFLSLESAADGQADPVEAQELADLLAKYQIPIAVLNACQSGKQVGETETSLGSRLMSAGVQLVLAMGYSVTVSAAELLMTTLYRQLFAGQPLAAAIRRGRLELYNQKGRRAYFNQVIDLEDWLLPVVYQNQAQTLRPREFTPGERAAYYEAHARRHQPPALAYGFFGRDLDILQAERRLLARRNLLLIRGMGGAGKTTLLHHLGAWWQTTHLVERVWYFGYDERAWTRQQILDAIARDLLDAATYHAAFQPLGEAAQQAMLAERLRATRHLLILDNLESITGELMAIQHTLDATERERLRDFLRALEGGRTLVLLGSRSGMDWLAPGAFGDNVYDLPGLDPEAASALAESILERHGALRYRDDADVLRLLKLLDGYPLPLEVVLANLARQTPAEVLAALQGGDAAIDMRSEHKTESILRCIEYAHSNLAPEAQRLLACLAPFTGVLFTGLLDDYTAHLRAQPALADLPFDRWQTVLQAAADWGLLAPHEVPGFLRLQPILPYFLRSRLAGGIKGGIETAFRQVYDQFGGEIFKLLQSKDAQEKQAGQLFAKLEYENLHTALDLALAAQVSIWNPYIALSRYLDTTQEQRRGLALGERVLARLESYPAEALTGPLGAEFVGVLDYIASRQLLLKQLPAAGETYQKALGLIEALQSLPAETRGKASASIYHQLGNVAFEQRQWAQAEQHYQRALEICVEFNESYAQARTYHQLGTVAKAQRQWAQAEQHYQRALEIKIEYNDRYAQASTYHQLGYVAQEQRQWAQAEQHYQRALEICVEFNDRYAKAGIYHQLGTVAQEQRQWVQAEQHYQRALEIYIAFNNRHGQARLYHSLGIVTQEQQQWAQAEQHYQRALEIYIAFNDRHGQAGLYHSLGIVAQEQRQWAQAEQHYQHALEIYIAFNDRYRQAATYHQLGMLAFEQQQWARAEQFYQRALELKSELNDRYAQASTYHQLGMVAQEQRQWAQARAYSLQALETLVAYEDQHRAGIALRSLSRLWQAGGDAGLPAAVAGVLGVSIPEAESRLRGSLPTTNEGNE